MEPLQTREWLVTFRDIKGYKLTGIGRFWIYWIVIWSELHTLCFQKSMNVNRYVLKLCFTDILFALRVKFSQSFTIVSFIIFLCGEPGVLSKLTKSDWFCTDIYFAFRVISIKLYHLSYWEYPTLHSIQFNSIQFNSIQFI